MREIKWTPKLVEVSKIKPTPVNYKIKTDIGKERLSLSMKLFGNASTVIVNSDYHLIDGNSRLEEEKGKGTKKMWVMLPDRKLSAKEYKEMSAMFDFAVAGTVDIDRINSDLGSNKDFYLKWKQEIPLEKLSKMGKAGVLPISDTYKYPDTKELPGGAVQNVCMVNLFFNVSQEKYFMLVMEKLMKKWKTKNVTDTIFKLVKTVK